MQPTHAHDPSLVWHCPPDPQLRNISHVVPVWQGSPQEQVPSLLQVPPLTMHGDGFGSLQSAPPKHPLHLHWPVAQSQSPWPLHVKSGSALGHVRPAGASRMALTPSELTM